MACNCASDTALCSPWRPWQHAGAGTGDRVEHGSVVPAAYIGELRALALTVVTRPGFVAARGDGYLADVDPAEHNNLWRCGFPARRRSAARRRQ